MNSYELQKICRICLKTDLLVSIFSPTFLMRPIEIIEKLHIFQPDDNLPNLLCQSCLYRLLDAYNLQQLAEASERRLREYLNVSAGAAVSHADAGNLDVEPDTPKDAEATAAAAIYANICDMFVRNVNSQDIEVEADEVLNDVEIDVSSLTRSEADDSLSEVFVGGHVDSQYDRKELAKEHEAEDCNSTPNAIDLPVGCKKCHRLDFVSETSGNTSEKPDGVNLYNAKPCPCCSKQSLSDEQMQQHTETSQRRYRCEICARFFSTSSNLKAHMLTHLEHRLFQCSHCERSFKSKRELRRHEPVHKAVKDIICDVCQKAFKRRSYLNTHMNAVHSVVRRHKCPDCAKVFCNRSNLVRHLRTHTGDKPFQCEICTWKFSQSSSLNRHMKTHAENNAENAKDEPQQQTDLLLKKMLRSSDSNTVEAVAEQTTYSMLQTYPTLEGVGLDDTDSSCLSSSSSFNSYDFAKNEILDFSTHQQPANETQRLF